jgi:hypothetical protein
MPRRSSPYGTHDGGYRATDDGGDRRIPSGAARVAQGSGCSTGTVEVVVDAGIVDTGVGVVDVVVDVVVVDEVELSELVVVLGSAHAPVENVTSSSPADPENVTVISETPGVGPRSAVTAPLSPVLGRSKLASNVPPESYRSTTAAAS